jgi:hypothetical protein
MSASRKAKIAFKRKPVDWSPTSKAAQHRNGTKMVVTEKKDIEDAKKALKEAAKKVNDIHGAAEERAGTLTRCFIA